MRFIVYFFIYGAIFYGISVLFPDFFAALVTMADKVVAFSQEQIAKLTAQ